MKKNFLKCIYIVVTLKRILLSGRPSHIHTYVDEGHQSFDYHHDNFYLC